MPSKRRTYEALVYLGCDQNGRQQYDWVGRYATKKQRDAAVAKRKLELAGEIAQAKLPPAERITCGEYADDTVARMESGALRTKSGRAFKDSSLDTTRQGLRRFTAAFGDRSLGGVERHGQSGGRKAHPTAAWPS
jgi:hypothetical protein